VSRTIGAVVSSGKASMYELSEHLGIEDLFDLLEILTVDSYNQRIMDKKNADSN